MYDLIGKDLHYNYVDKLKKILIVFCVIIVAFLIGSLIDKTLLILVVGFVIINTIFYILLKKHKKMYCNRLFIDDKELRVYNYKNQKMKVYKKEELKSEYAQIAFPGPKRMMYKTCLVLFNGIKPPKIMKYNECLKNDKIIVIENKELVKIVEEYFQNTKI